MQRRDFLALSAAAAVVPFAARAAILDYSDGMIDEALARGETVFVDYSATWCGTCKAQGRVIDALLAQNPAYDAAITFFKVDWDTYKNAPITVMHNIPRRSTLIVLKGDAELGRIVAGTGKAQIQELMDIALAAATA